ncbi:MAG: hypothetical protein ACI4LY_03435 [Candidatus Fimisoma sp.]
MKIVNKLMMLLLMTIIVVLPTNVNADTIRSQLQPKDSYSLTQDEYITVVNMCDTEQKPIATCEAFIKMFRAYSRGGDYNPSALVAKEKKLTDNLLYRKSEADYKRAVSEIFDLKILSDSIKLNVVKEDVRDSNAIIEIQENYEYTLETDKDEKFYRNRKYSFNLKKENDNWFIESVKTNDPWEQRKSFDYKPINVESIIMSLKDECSQVKTCETLIDEKKRCSGY